MKNDEITYTYEDLVDRMRTYSELLGEKKKFEGLRDSARAAMDSHQIDIDRLQERCDRARAEVAKVVRKLEI